MDLTKRELNTVLAALRYFKATMPRWYGDSGNDDYCPVGSVPRIVRDSFDENDPLSRNEIDALRRKLNP